MPSAVLLQLLPQTSATAVTEAELTKFRPSDKVRQKIGNYAARKVYYTANYAIFLSRFNLI